MKKQKKNFLYLMIAAFLLCAVIGIGSAVYRNDLQTAKNVTLQDTLRTHDTRAAPAFQDGRGSAVISPSDDVAASASGTWILTFTVAEPGIAAGGGVVFHIPPFWGWTPPQLVNPAAPGYTTITCSNPAAACERATSAQNSYTLVRAAGSGLVPGDVVTVTYGDTRLGTYPEARGRADRYAEQHERFFVKVDGDGDGYFAPLAQHPTLNILPGPPSRLIVTAPSQVTRGAPFTVRVAAVDRMENWVCSSVSGITLAALPSAVTITRCQEDPRIQSFACTIPGEGVYTFSAHDRDNNLSGTSNPVVCGEHNGRYKLFWGDLHGHSRLSDGTGTAADYFEYARFAAGLDAAALTDHDAWGFETLDEHASIWKHCKGAALQHYAPDRFVTFMGYEWTNWTYGHKHVLFLDEPAPLFSYRNPESDTPEKLWKQLKSCRALTISHHVGGGPIGTDWNFHDSDMEPVVEISSIHGCSEYRGCPAGIYRPQEGSFVRDALGRGYPLGLIAGGDTHNGHPGQGDPLTATGGINAFYAERLTREALWEAIKQRRVYATTGERIIIDFKINGHWMGEIISSAENPVRKIFSRVIGTDRLALVEIIKNNKTFSSWENSGPRCDAVITDDAEPSAGDFYYLRVVQANRQMAWSSPVWVH